MNSHLAFSKSSFSAWIQLYTIKHGNLRPELTAKVIPTYTIPTAKNKSPWFDASNLQITLGNSTSRTPIFTVLLWALVYKEGRQLIAMAESQAVSH